MPKHASRQSAVEKSKQRIKQSLKKGQTRLQFVSYEDKTHIIYKLNKYHYLDTNKIVISQDVISHLARLAQQPNTIEELCFNLCGIKDEGCIQLVKGNWEKVVSLSLDGNQLTSKAVEAFAGNGKFAALRQLSLNSNLLDAVAAQHLSRGNWKHLQKLLLNFNGLGDQGLQSLIGHSWLKLKQLHLMNINLANQGVSGLVQMNTPYLHHLILSNNLLTDQACLVLSRGQWRHLKSLDLDGNYLKNQAMDYLSRLACFHLKEIKLFGRTTRIMDVEKKEEEGITIDGMGYLAHGCWNKLKVVVKLDKESNNQRNQYTALPSMKEMLERGNLTIPLFTL